MRHVVLPISTVLAIVLMSDIYAATAADHVMRRARRLHVGSVVDQSPATLAGENDALRQYTHRPGDFSRMLHAYFDTQLSAHMGLPSWRSPGEPVSFLPFPDSLASESGGGTEDFFLIDAEHGVLEDENTAPGALERDWRGLGRDSAFFLGYQVGVAGFLYLLPESVTQWTPEQKKTSMRRWWENVQHPQWDKDTWYVNYLGHPYFGAISYIRARERGFGVFGGFGFAAFLSTLYEYGIEALFERPSYQDLIITPVAGLLLGALLFEPLRERLHGKPELEWYDHVTLFVTDPMGAANSALERALGIEADIRVQFHLQALASQEPSTEPSARSLSRPQEQVHWSPGVGITLVFGERRPPARRIRWP
jgi:hypothetical protein